METETVQPGPDEARVEQAKYLPNGCIFDASRGHQMGEAVIDLAKSLGWNGSTLECGDGHPYFEMWNWAEQYLNELLAPNGRKCGPTANGDWFIHTNKWWGEDDS